MHQALTKSFKEAEDLFQVKREQFASCCVLFHDRIPEWEKEAEKAKRLPNGIIQGIYQHTTPVPSKTKIYKQLLASNMPTKVSKASEDKGDRLLYVIQQGLMIQNKQERIRGKLTVNQTETALISPDIVDLIAELPDCEIEDEKLFLPSDMTEAERILYLPDALIQMECKVRDGDLHDNKIRVERDCCIRDYLRARQALINLKCVQRDELPVMTEADTYQFTTVQPRQLGDSRRTYGQMNTFRHQFEVKHLGEDAVVLLDTAPIASTQSLRQVPRHIEPKAKTDKEPEVTKEDGWIWSDKLVFGARLTSGQISKFNDDTEMERWGEVKEKCHSDFLHSIRGFDRMQEVWNKMADKAIATSSREDYPATLDSPSGWCSSFGHAAFAQHQAKMYEQLRNECSSALQICGLQLIPSGQLLSDVVAAQRTLGEVEFNKQVEVARNLIQRWQMEMDAFPGERMDLV
ncbi:hypothetical protein BDP27DRAFT_1424033 [Rhodocollybia butyracea]|uniref:Uncharacterized protein n=1 Tax=Rhodocollybia butyracea TaxID=206335 RepID=A0A9P5PPL1_9AGAR|nr:hypothetical protein BDP27DRAFT_1424033 [Rhodocollybia butyracea]